VNFLPTSSDSPASTASAATATADPERPYTSRWMDLKEMSSSFRYRQAFNQGGAKTFDDGQQRMMIINTFKLDKDQKYTIHLRADSGGYFNWSYADMAGHGFAYRQHNGWIKSSYTPAQAAERSAAGKADPAGLAITTGTISTGWRFYIRELWLSATPEKHVNVEFGSLGIERGYGSEITTFDDDGWVSGERITFKDVPHLFFNEVGYTNAYFGDIGTPNFFDRGSSLTSFNYRQVFAKKRVNKHVSFSAEYNFLGGTHTTREAALIDAKPTKAFDAVRVELYQRYNTVNLQGLNVGGGDGFAVTLEKQINRRIGGNIGYADVDGDYSVYAGHRVQHAVGLSMNGDSYGQGKHPFIHTSIKLTPFMSLFGFYTHAIDNVLDLGQQNFNAGLSFDLKAMANFKTKVF
jgi:hypothetical protein